MAFFLLRNGNGDGDGNGNGNVDYIASLDTSHYRCLEIWHAGSERLMRHYNHTNT